MAVSEDQEFPPGWFPEAGTPDTFRWWDGRQWSRQTGVDPRVKVGALTPDGFLCTWSAPYGWPTPPDGWFPGPGWTPPLRLPFEPGFRWWAITPARNRGLNSEAEGPISMISTALDLERRFPDLPEFFALAAEERVWVPPPGWPAAPAGWTPPTAWRPAPSWGPAPDDWEFMRADPAVVRRKMRRQDRLFSNHPLGLEMLLNRVEDYAAWAAVSAARLNELADACHGAGVGDALSAPETALLETAVDDVVRRSSAARTYALYALYGAAVFDDQFHVVRTKVTAAVGKYFRVAIRILGRLFQRIKEVRDSGSDTPQMTLLLTLGSSTYEILAIHNPDPDSGADSSKFDDHGDSTATWARAEELAAQELRSRGFRDAQRTPAGADGGFDVEGRGVVAQVKYLGTPVGREVIQRLTGANLHGARMAFFSRSGYTRQAVAFADVARVALFTIDVDDDSVDEANPEAESFWA